MVVLKPEWEQQIEFLGNCRASFPLFNHLYVTLFCHLCQYGVADAGTLPKGRLHRPTLLNSKGYVDCFGQWTVNKAMCHVWAKAWSVTPCCPRSHDNQRETALWAWVPEERWQTAEPSLTLSAHAADEKAEPPFSESRALGTFIITV